MAFYLKLLEIYNIYGLFIFYVVRYITHRAGCPGRPPGPGSLRSGCRPPAVLRYAIITLSYPSLSPPLLPFCPLAIERLKTPSVPLSRGTPKKAIKQT